MENLLRKRLEAIKSRAKSVGQNWLGRSNAAAAPKAEREDGFFDLTLHGPAEPIDKVAPGEVIERDGEAFYLVTHTGPEIADDAGDALAKMLGFAAQPSWPFTVLDLDLYTGSRRPLDPERVCFFDIETTGLAPNTYCFLSGVMLVRNGRFVVEQLLARDYGEEGAALAYLNDIFRNHSVIVSYNGATFDLPFVRTRMAVTRVGSMASNEHLDLLYPSRRRYRETLPNCKLATIERHLRGVDRSGDIPGRYIPEAYHRFVDTGDARHMGNVLYHNRMDLLAMAIVLNDLAGTRPAPAPRAVQGSLF